MLFFSIVFAGGPSELRERPPELQRSTECSLWRGTAKGNDPSTLLELEVCGDRQVTGRLQWSSTQSGHNLRTIAGSWNRHGLTFHDTEMVSSSPSEGWYFCEIENYALGFAGPGVLSGTYESSACWDHAELTLTLVEGSPPPTADLPPAIPKATRWACATLPIVGILPLFSVLAATRRRRC